MSTVVEGDLITFDDGTTLNVPPRSDRVFGTIWPNGAFIEVIVYQEPQPNEDPADRIHLMIHPEGQEQRGWIMTIEDALCIIQGLSTGIQEAIRLGIPLCSA